MMYELGCYSDSNFCVADLHDLFKNTIISTARKRYEAGPLKTKSAKRPRAKNDNVKMKKRDRKAISETVTSETAQMEDCSIVVMNGQVTDANNITLMIDGQGQQVKELITEGNQNYAILFYGSKVPIIYNGQTQ